MGELRMVRRIQVLGTARLEPFVQLFEHTLPKDGWYSLLHGFVRTLNPKLWTAVSRCVGAYLGR